jgi:hypothetical protein
MGLLAKSATKRAVAPVSTAVGEWLPSLANAHPYLSRRDLFNLTLMEPLFATTESARSSWLTGSKATTSEIEAKTLGAVLRLEGDGPGGLSQFSVAVPSPTGNSVFDWRLNVQLADNGDVEISVGAYRTREDKLLNERVLEHVRERIPSALAVGPILARTDGPPDLDANVTRCVLSGAFGKAKSPFANDYLVPLPAEFVHGATLSLPKGTAKALSAVLPDSEFPSIATGDGLRAIDLSGGRPIGGVLRVVADHNGDRLLLDWPTCSTESDIGRQRTFRLAMRALRDLALRSARSAPDAATVIETYIARLATEPNNAENRSDSFVPAWSDVIAAEAVTMPKRGGWLPIGIVCTAPDETLWPSVMAAEASLTVRQRTWARGLTQRTRDKTRSYSARRPIVLRSTEGKTIPYLRYGASFAMDVDKYGTYADNRSWFWEARLGSKILANGRRRSLLLAQGLSHTDGFISYGMELFGLFRGFCWAVKHQFPDAELSTLWLQRP